MIYKIENEYLIAYISDLGATLTKLFDKKSGKDIVLGFDDEDSYIKERNYFGASVGRNANRIGKAKFILNNKEYQLSVNDHVNQLHGGIDNFSFKRWEVKSSKEDNISLSYFSKDLEEGFPGNLDVIVSYALEKNNLIWRYSGKSDKDTVLNMTNHSYFNLGDESILNHELKVFTDKYCAIDAYGLTLDAVLNTNGTPFDFKDYTLLKNNLFKFSSGIDNNYFFEDKGLDEKEMVSLKYKNLILNIYSDLPDMHLYTANVLNKCVGKNNTIYKKHSGICFECQFYPNSINYNRYIKPIIKADEPVTHYIRYEIVSK